MGWGRFGGGEGVTRFLAKSGARITVTDLRQGSDLVGIDESLPVRFVLGQHRDEDFTQTDVLMVNPAVPPSSPHLRLAAEAGVLVDTEINLFLRLSISNRVLAVTGSNGKSTTTSLLAEMLSADFPHVLLGGNVGRSLLACLDSLSASTPVVLELSSFQIQRMSEAGLGVHGAVLLNLMPNHLDWHGSWESYVDAKAGLLENLSPGGWALLNGTEDQVRRLATRVRGRVFYYGEGDPLLSWVERSGTIRCSDPSPDWTLCGASEIQLRGSHNLLNVAGAAGAALLGGATPEGVRRGVRAFRPLPHRLEPCGKIHDVQFFNDSVSTTPESTAAALYSFEEPIHLILGGKNKGLDLAGLVSTCAGRCASVTLIGATTDVLLKAFREAGSPPPTVEACASFYQAIRTAYAQAKPGDVVLLSPACASYDMFTNFEERGNLFREFVKANLCEQA